jgi:ribosomal protein S18 acetylase RimI-like enzyme
VDERPAPPTFQVLLDLTIRPATAADVEALVWYGSQAWRLDALRRIHARQEAGDAVFLMAISPEPRPDGFPVGQLAVDTRAERHRGVAVLWSLAVLPHLQGLGIATRLMGEAEGVATTAGLVAAELAVNKANEVALRLYRRLGYGVVGERVEGYWRPGDPDTGPDVWEEEDCWVMLKPLA